MPHAGDDLHAVRLNLHTAAASVALLPPPELAVDSVQIDRYARGESGQRRYQALAVRLTGGLKSKHQGRVFMVAPEHFRFGVRILFRVRSADMIKFLLF